MTPEQIEKAPDFLRAHADGKPVYVEWSKKGNWVEGFPKAILIDSSNPFKVEMDEHTDYFTDFLLEPPKPELVCYDCGRKYGDPGFPDLVINNKAWKQISPSSDEGGLLCPSCICARLEKNNIQASGKFTSGPLCELPEKHRPKNWESM